MAAKTESAVFYKAVLRGADAQAFDIEILHEASKATALTQDDTI